MLSTTTPRHGADEAIKYYLDVQMDYYLQGLRKAGQWQGQGAVKLGLPESVDRETFRHLLEGFSPDGKNKLVQNAGAKDRQCYWDFTFSAPKPVSVLWAMAPDSIRHQIERMHQEAVQEALIYAEKIGGLTRRGKGGRSVERADLVFATFFEGTSREQDPQLHSHCLLVNLCVRQDGTTGTLRTQELFDYKPIIGERYQLALAARLRQELALEIALEQVGFRIVGVPKPVCRAFSKRSQKIRQRMRELGLKGAVAAKIVTLETRPAKAEVPAATLFAKWREEGQVLGWSTEQAVALLQQAQQKTQEPVPGSARKSLVPERPADNEPAKVDDALAPVLGNDKQARRRAAAAEKRRQQREDREQAFQESIDAILRNYKLPPRPTAGSNQNSANQRAQGDERRSDRTHATGGDQPKDQPQRHGASHSTGERQRTKDAGGTNEQQSQQQEQHRTQQERPEQAEQGDEQTRRAHEKEQARQRAQQQANELFWETFLAMLDRMHLETQTRERLERLAWWLSYQLGADAQAVEELFRRIIPGAECTFVHVEIPRLFPKALWKPLRKLRASVVRLGKPPRKWTDTWWKRTVWPFELRVGGFRLFPAVELRVQQRRWFPGAPEWSPLHGLYLPAFRLTLKPVDLVPTKPKPEPPEEPRPQPSITH